MKLPVSIWHIAPIALLVSLTAVGQTTASTDDQAPAHKSITPSQLHSFLRQPQGLERLSLVVGDISIDETSERWGEHNLSSLVSQSTNIVTAKILQKQSYLTEDGDSIRTDYSLHVLNTIKGNPANDITVVGQGGTVKLPTGRIAAIHTETWNSLDPGKTVLIFLRPSGEKYQIVGDIQGAMEVSGADSEVHLFDRNPSHNVGLRKEFEGTPLHIAEEKLRSTTP